jgi:hypothetical protein
MRLIYWLLGLVQVIGAALLPRKGFAERRAFRWALSLVLAVSGLAWLWFGTRDLLMSEPEGTGASALAPYVENQLGDQGALLGLVQGGELVILAPAASAGASARLTEISMIESVGPESKEIDLQPYEGTSLVVRGHDGGGWIYEAEIVEQGGPLFTALVQRVYSAP